MIQEIMADLSGFLTYARSFRRTGSFVLDACLHCRRCDGCRIWEKTVKHWDVSAISVILTEAGGKLTDLNGVHYYTGLPELVASNGVLHSEILNLLKTVRSTVSRKLIEGKRLESFYFFSLRFAFAIHTRYKIQLHLNPSGDRSWNINSQKASICKGCPSSAHFTETLEFHYGKHHQTYVTKPQQPNQRD
uniref:Uncharacterized 22 kDa protein in trpE 5'region n=1 Tax=Leptospira biflexa TaxID=172 RepID=YTRE_LEPBI|nr:RecName: Full=Uncharacterized 22 kDa protein in trpE 5'region [Leptospira biflexa]AAA88215.1 unknown protein [Leptospira biflexa serovar Patoc strain 'Patoc 1 (Paris)']